MFMKHKLLYLFTLLFMATSVGWGQNNSLKSSSELTFKGTDEDVNLFKTSMGITKGSWVIIYGNGFPMTIEKTKNAASDNQITVTFNGQQAPDPISLTGEEKAIIFGGSKGVDLDDDTSITLKSGDVGYIIGGGWGTKGGTATDPKTANVKNVLIDIQNGSVGLIYSGGLYRANVGDINLNIKNAVIDHIYCGGFDQGQTSNTIETEWDSSVNQAVTSTLNMDNSTVNGYLFLGGGQGYSYSKEVKATISKSKLRGGILGTGSNGRSNKVVATVSGCTFERITNGDIIEIAPINRGYVKEVEMTFDGCTFPKSLDDYKAYLGATYCYDGKSKAEVDKVSLHFANCINTPEMRLSHGLENADVTLTGTKAIVGTTYESSSKTLNAYTVATGKEWNLGGIRYEGEATLTNNGSLSITCPTVDDLVAAVKAKASTITLDAETYSLTSQLVIGNSLKLTGKSKTETIITADKSWTGDAKDLIKVAVTENTPATISLLKSNKEIINGVSLSALTIKGAQGNGLVANSPVTLTNMALTDNKEAGLKVASTTVTATNVTTSGNGESGVNIERGQEGTSGSTNFTFDETSFFYEDNKIKANADNLVTVPNNSAWTPVEGENNNFIYTTAPSITTETLSPFPGKNWKGTYTFVYANGKPITITQSEAGKINISVDGTNEYVELLESANPVIFGGSKDKTVESSTITMNSGTIYMLLGGGYGTIETDKTSEKHAGVTGSTKISINGGKINNTLFGGGLYYNHSKDVTIDIKGDLTVGQWLICGGFESGVTSGANYQDFDKSNNTVESATLTIDGGTYGYIAVGGTDGAKGYIKESNATIKNAKASGLYANGSNGRSDKVSIVAENCTFEKPGNGPVEIASLNRGNTTNVDITFTDCTFPENESDIYVYLGATYNTLLNYKGSEYGIKPDNEGKASVKFTFKGGTNVPKVGVSDGLKDADVTLTGAVGYIDQFATGATGGPVKAFTITEGKSWTFGNGLEIVKADEENKQATLTYAANATGDTKAGTLTIGGTMTPAKEDDVTAALKGDKPSASEFDVTGLDGWTSDKLAEKLNEKFYAENVTEGKRTEPFSGIKFICKDGESKVTVYSDKDAANADANPDAKYLVWDDTAKKYKTGENSVEAKSPITLTIKVSDVSDVTSVKVNGEDATKESNGTYKVYAGQKLSVKFETKSNYSVSATINGTRYTNESEYTVPADVEALEMKITYTYVPDDPSTTDPDPEPTEEVKLSFDTTEKTVKVGNEFTLNVTVTGAESSRIVWTSSNSNVATVTSNGKVKAVGTGTATITARIGDVEAVCTLTVEAQPTGIEAVSAGTKLYTVGGQIVIIPAEPVQVTVHAATGVCIYTGRISEALYIPASAGIYLVTLSAGKGEATEKVSVR